jgi:hypothetical protein
MRHAAAVQYCSHVGKLREPLSRRDAGKALILLLRKLMSAPESDPKPRFMGYAAKTTALISSLDCREN